ncbi:MAG: DedA family protein [Brachymonas sp.]|nr:DedA family protein [Brachymonas sp.]
MQVIQFLISFILHIDQHIITLVQNYGPWIYALLFLILFVETGVVVMPFLPGDSLLFIVGALCATGQLRYDLAAGLMLVAAILGDQCNYSIGRWMGPKVFQWENSRFFNKKAFEQANAFYERYGGITIILARFMPFMRTFVPFVAGVAHMSRGKFTLYNVVGGVLWVIGVTAAGYFFGNIPWVQENLQIIIWGLILVPGVLALFGAWKASRNKTPETA